MNGLELLWLVYTWLPTAFFVDLSIHSVLVLWKGMRP